MLLRDSPADVPMRMVMSLMQAARCPVELGELIRLRGGGTRADDACVRSDAGSSRSPAVDVTPDQRVPAAFGGFEVLQGRVGAGRIRAAHELRPQLAAHNMQSTQCPR